MSAVESSGRRLAELLDPLRDEPRSKTVPVQRALTFESSAGAGSRAWVRRVVNVAAALILLVVAAPLMAFIAVLIKLTSPGPVLYHQPRVGLDRRAQEDRRESGRHGHDRRARDRGGRVFSIMKFRTMEVEGGADDPVWTSPEDPRITSLGRFLRLSRLDELPQLFNVLQGDMNLVGPRPEQPGIFEELRGQIHNYQQRQSVLPGITGWAQVNQSYDQCLDDVQRKIDLDLEYIDRRSITEDVKIMAKTLPVMLFRRGAL
jgi:lipopolysaccharide/colanic/teichoic acid biosynthesis glycosyltransferase